MFGVAGFDFSVNFVVEIFGSRLVFGSDQTCFCFWILF